LVSGFVDHAESTLSWEDPSDALPIQYCPWCGDFLFKWADGYG
jgi:hypothetical protein